MSVTMWRLPVLIGTGLGMDELWDLQLEEEASMRQIIEDQRSEHAYRIRWRVLGASAGPFLRIGILCTLLFDA